MGGRRKKVTRMWWRLIMGLDRVVLFSTPPFYIISWLQSSKASGTSITDYIKGKISKMFT